MDQVKISPEKINRILIVQLAGLGDLIMATPALRAIRAKFSQSRISLLTTSRAKEAVISSPYIDEIFILDKYLGFLSFFKPKSIIDTLKLIKILREKHFDMAINLFRLIRIRGVIRMALLFYLIKAKYRVGRDTDGLGFFFNIKVPEKEGGPRHEVERILDVARTLGAGIIDKHLEICVSSEDRERASEFLRQNQILDSNLIIGLNPGAFIPSHLWGKENFAKLGDELVKRYQAKIVITGGPDEIELANEIAGMMQIKPIIAAGVMSLKQDAVLMERYNLFITSGTGGMHMAAAMNTPLIALLGPDFVKYFPYGERCAVIKKDVDCSPCYKLKCKKHLCMELITVEEILEAAKDLLEKFPK